jgi:ABC-type transport system involved in multi-copper enzyme maturation permease subunit
MTFAELDARMIRLLVVKDWQVYQKQLAGYLAGLLLALSLIGTGKLWSFNAGGLLLIVLLVSTGFFAIGHIVLNERKESTLPFVMSLPVSPLDLFAAKLLAGLLIYLVPFLLVVATTALLVLATSLPDGLLVYAMLVYFFMLMSYCVALCVAIAVESEGWNIFIQMALMTMLSPFMIWAGGLQSIASNLRTNHIVLSPAVLSVFAGEILVIALAFALTCWVHSRKASFLQDS